MSSSSEDLRVLDVPTHILPSSSCLLVGNEHQLLVKRHTSSQTVLASLLEVVVQPNHTATFTDDGSLLVVTKNPTEESERRTEFVDDEKLSSLISLLASTSH